MYMQPQDMQLYQQPQKLVEVVSNQGFGQTILTDTLAIKCVKLCFVVCSKTEMPTQVQQHSLPASLPPALAATAANGLLVLDETLEVHPTDLACSQAARGCASWLWRLWLKCMAARLTWQAQWAASACGVWITRWAT
jgi:hypothetical protein